MYKRTAFKSKKNSFIKYIANLYKLIFEENDSYGSFLEMNRKNTMDQVFLSSVSYNNRKKRTQKNL
ncbi:hypothetical protein ACM46_18150 [Chryseobacterium angstadtii]|uniref:Uncharacterized protein n=1 Tax=Chryseobacterium angstadtii TaxID=558151 RepID=A0A0J7I2X9_9FLAO|nr:hypothetical protein ACM46_18150 [Chryseobacterium angstadtii]